MKEVIIKDSKLIKICFLTLVLGILALGFISDRLNQEQTAIVKKINQNNRFLNITIQIGQDIIEATAFTNQKLNIEEGDYISIKGTKTGNTIKVTKLTKLKMLPN